MSSFTRRYLEQQEYLKRSEEKESDAVPYAMPIKRRKLAKGTGSSDVPRGDLQNFAEQLTIEGGGKKQSVALRMLKRKPTAKGKPKKKSTAKGKPVRDRYIRTLPAIAKRLHMNKRTVQRHAEKKHLHVEKINRIIHCKESEIARFLKEYNPSVLE